MKVCHSRSNSQPSTNCSTSESMRTPQFQYLSIFERTSPNQKLQSHYEQRLKLLFRNCGNRTPTTSRSSEMTPNPSFKRTCLRHAA